MRIRPDKLERMDRLAEIVSAGHPVSDAGISLGLSKGETARTWSNIKRGLGPQAI